MKDELGQRIKILEKRGNKFDDKLVRRGRVLAKIRDEGEKERGIKES
jgi:hypothetical protein